MNRAATSTPGATGAASRSQASVTSIVGGEQTGGRFALIETVEVAGCEPPCHLHQHEDEMLYVLEGRLAVYVGGEWIAAGTGGAVFLPRGVEHSFAVQAGAARVLTMLSPAGFEGFYHELGGPTPWGCDDAPAIERLLATAARYGCAITGPHPGYP